MFEKYLLLSLRNLIRNKTVSFIYVAGFGLGIAAFLFAAQTVIFEYSFDDSVKDRNKIFVIGLSGRNYSSGEEGRNSRIDPALWHRIHGTIPELKYAARLTLQTQEDAYGVFTYVNHSGEKKTFNETDAKYADPDFLKIFELPVYLGSLENALSDVTSLIMTRSTAVRYFGYENPIGKTLVLTTGGTESRKTKFDYRVAAVLEDLPANSTLKFDILLPFRNFEENYKQDLSRQWMWFGSFYTFIKTNEEIEDTDALEAKINKMVPDEVRRSWKEFGWKSNYDVTRFSNFHFDQDELRAHQLSPRLRISSKNLVNTIGIIGLSILVIAMVNYINLTTARASKRAKEIGIRKVSGAGKMQLINQFTIDAFMVCLFGFLFALTLLQLAKPLMTVWIGLTTPEVSWWSAFSIISVAVLIVCTLASGIVPAMLLVKTEPITALKGKITRSTSGGFLRRVLVVVQFSISITLVVFTLAIEAQLTFMQAKDPGFNKEQRIAIRAAGTEDLDLRKFRTFRNRLNVKDEVLGITAINALPGLKHSSGAQFTDPQNPHQKIAAQLVITDFDFASTMGIPVLAGRDFTDRFENIHEILINESAVKEFGFFSPEAAIGKTLEFLWVEGYQTLRIIGVIGDFNLLSPRERVHSTVYFFANTTHTYGKYYYYVVHAAAGDLQQTLEIVQKEWKAIFPDAPFEYTFLDDAFQKVFEQEEKIQSVVTLFTLLAIVIACMGLGGLVAYSVSLRTKEIGIRKTLGASVGRILYLLTRDFIRLILIAMGIAIPLVWYAVSEFLKNYEYRIELSAWLFIFPCLVLLVIALITMSYQTLKAARANPAAALKYE